jgi:predicted regulator of Ras-like GTPase activity (Roadblock/LC7/MglB family)
VRAAEDLNLLMTSFAEQVPDVMNAAVVSSDGLPVASSRGLPADMLDQLAAVTSGLTSLVQGATRIFQGGPVTQTVIVMQHGMLILMALNGGTVLAVLAEADCDMGLVTYEMRLLADRVGQLVTPQARGPLGAPGAGPAW